MLGWAVTAVTVSAILGLDARATDTACGVSRPKRSADTVRGGHQVRQGRGEQGAHTLTFDDSRQWLYIFLPRQWLYIFLPRSNRAVVYEDRSPAAPATDR